MTQPPLLLLKASILTIVFVFKYVRLLRRPSIHEFDRGRGDGILGSERNKYRIDSCGTEKYYFSSSIWSLPNLFLTVTKI